MSHTQPAISEVDLSKVRELGNLLVPQLCALREKSPIYWSDAQQLWIVTGYDEVAEGFQSKGATSDIALSEDRMVRVFSCFPESEKDRIPNVMTLFPKFLINIDPPAHFQLRKILMKAFTKKISESYRPLSREIIQSILKKVEQKREIDFVVDVAFRVPGLLMLRLMNLADDYYPRLRPWSLAVARGLGGGVDPSAVVETDSLLAEMREIFQREIDLRRKAPTGDFISALISAEEDGERLTDEEIIATCILTIVAGQDTTSNTLTLISVLLAQQPDIHNHFHREGEVTEAELMELMRYVAMSTAQFRVVARDFEWRGHQLKKGQKVWLAIAAANRDPKVFSNPERLDFERPQNKNLTFAPGVHHCIGHYLAKMQQCEFIKAWVDRFEPAELLEDRLDWDTPLTFRGLRTLHMRVTPRPH
jgi:pimeloyl-[acyl-carrier protein] synthase